MSTPENISPSPALTLGRISKSAAYLTAFGLIGLGSSLSAQTLYWNGGYEGDQGWAANATGTTPWSTTDTGEPTTYWVNDYNAVFTESNPTLSIWTVRVNDLEIQDGATFTVSGTSNRVLNILGAGSGDFTIQDNDTNDGILRIMLNGTSAWDGVITVNEFSDNTSGLILSDPLGGGTAGTGKSTRITLNNGSLMLGAGAVDEIATIGELSGTGTVRIRSSFSSTAGVRTLQVDQDTNTTFSGTFGDDTTRTDNHLALTKAGAGTLTVSSVSGNSTDAWGGYRGETNVESGKLYFIGSSDTSYTNVLGQDNVNVANGATLGMDGTFTFAPGVDGAITVADGGILDPGQQNQAGTMTIAGGSASSIGLAFEGNATVLFTVGSNQDSIVLSNDAMTGSASGGANSILFSFTDSGDTEVGIAYDLISFGGTAQSIALSTFGLSADSLSDGWDGVFSYGGDGNTLQFTPSSIPEPGVTALMLGSVVIGAVLYTRRRKQ